MVLFALYSKITNQIICIYKTLKYLIKLEIWIFKWSIWHVNCFQRKPFNIMRLTNMIYIANLSREPASVALQFYMVIRIYQINITKDW